jgi:ActR/RegA family two-component response regulator
MSTEIVEVGDKTALICDDGPGTESLKSTLEQEGFKCHMAETPERAIERMKYTSYDVITIDQNFGGSTLEMNSVLMYLAPLPMAQRRNSFVVLIGDGFRTLDAMQAYARSVHLVVNPSDLSNMGAILKKCLADFETFYRMYRSVLAETEELA